MSTIRRQSIISSLVIYFGFAIGLLNTYFFTKEGLFSPSDYGLTTIFIAIATTMMAFASLAMPSYIFKFYPYYTDNLPSRKNDMLTIALVMGTIGFLLVIIAGWVFKNLVIRKFGENSPQLVNYYYWIFPMGFGLTIYSILEVYAWGIGKSVLTNFLKEVQWRLFTTILIVLFIFNVIPNFDLFIKLFAFTYPGIALTLFLYLLFTKKIHLVFSISKVTRRYLKKIITFCLFVYSGFLIFTISQVFDSIVIAAVLDKGLAKAGIFTLATILTSVIQAPQRAIISVSVPILSRAWKEKDLGLLQRIYQRSSINLLIFALAIYLLIVLNYRDAIHTFGLKEIYLQGFNVFLLLGLTRIVDMGTGVNEQILVTSNYWRFQLISGVILLILMLPLTYFLAKKYDLIGPAIANLISISIYNLVRIVFLWNKFKLFPFTLKSLYALAVAAICFLISYYTCRNIHGLGGLVIRSMIFITTYAAAMLYFKLTPDIQPVVTTIRKRLGITSKEKI